MMALVLVNLVLPLSCKTVDSFNVRRFFPAQASHGSCEEACPDSELTAEHFKPLHRRNLSNACRKATRTLPAIY